MSAANAFNDPVVVVADDRECRGPLPAALLDRFGSVQNVVNADREQLSGVDGIGKKTAQRIDWAVRERESGYRIPA